MGLLDRARKLAEQAIEVGKDKGGEALAEVRSRSQSTAKGQAAPPPDDRYGTPYVPGMLGKPGWRELDLPDPAGVLPIGERDRAGIPHSTKSEILEEPFGIGRRWTSGERSAGFYYRVDAGHRSWAPPSPAPFAGVEGAVTATLDDGRTLVLFADGDRQAVVETSGLDPATAQHLATVAATELSCR